MSDAKRGRDPFDRDEPDEWLIDMARRAGHKLPVKERPSGTSAWRVLLSAGLADDEVLRLACAGSGADPADFTQLSPSLADVLSHAVALKHRVAPLGVHRGTLNVATSNPRNPDLERDLAFAARQRVRLFAASPTDVIRAQGMVYGAIYESRGGPAASMPIGAPAAAPVASIPRPAPPPRRSLPMTIPVEVDDEPLTLSVEPVILSPPGEAEALALEPRADAEAGLTIERITEPLIGAAVDAPEPVASEAEASAPAAPTPPPVAAPAPPPARPAPPAPDLGARLLATAIAERASDAILEPTPDGGLLVRLCVDGTLNDRFRIPAAQAPRMLQLLKQRAQLDPGIAAPARGRIAMDSPDGPVVVRFTSDMAPGDRERVSLRLFSRRALLGIGDLGLAGPELQRVQAMLTATAGLLVVAGPHGAGVTTTTYALARALHDAGRRVATVEPLVEYPLDGIAQSAAGGATSAATVRGTLAADGDVVVVGTPLDAATLQQGRLVSARSRLLIATLPTPDLASTLGELQALHPDRARLAATLGGVVVQRLLRRLCKACAAPQVAGELPDHQQRLLHGLPMAHVRRPVGCDACRGTGYAGRVAIAQIVLMTPGFRVAIRRGASPAELARLATDSGAPTLWASGLDRVLRGVTSLAELVDTVPPPADGGTAPQEDIDALLSQLLGASSPAPVTGEHPLPETAEPQAERAPRHSAVDGFTLVSAQAAGAAPAPCVLVVDDDAATRRTLARALQALGFRVLQAADGASALSFARRLRPDVILTEVALPGLDAVGLLAALAAEALAVPVLVHTDQRDDALAAWLVESGAHAVLPRGTDATEIGERIKAVVAG